MYLRYLVLLDAEQNERALSQLWLINTELFMETKINASMNQSRGAIWITQRISGTYSGHLVFVDVSNEVGSYFIIM